MTTSRSRRSGTSSLAEKRQKLKHLRDVKEGIASRSDQIQVPQSNAGFLLGCIHESIR
jgi:hypothetical protein